MMTFGRTLTLFTATIVLGVTAASAAERNAARVLLAQSTATLSAEAVEAVTPVAQAEQEVEAARAVLRRAMAGHGNVREARRALRKALKRLDQAKANPDQPLPPLETETAKPAAPATIEAAPKAPATVELTPLPKVEPLPATGQSEQPQVVLEAEEGRIITREGGQLTIRHDDSDRLAGGGGERHVETSSDGLKTITVVRPNGNQLVTIKDRHGDIIQRYRRLRSGELEFLIGGPNSAQARHQQPRPSLTIDLPRLQVTIPERDYIVESDRASERQLEQALIAPPVEQVERTYSLREIRGSGRLRNKLRRIDVDTVTFEFGSADIPNDQIPRMEKIGDALNRVVSRNPGEVFLIEGHTDAVGSDYDNLALSDRRAETVAEILTYYFAIPPENLVTQGYGEQFLKIPTAGPARANRRVTLRRITPLLRPDVF